MAQVATVGVDLGGSAVRAGRVRSGIVEKREERSLIGGDTDVMTEIFAAVDAVMSDGVRGLGVGAPSVVDASQGVVYNVASIPSWDAVPLREVLETRYGRPAYVDNDANAFVAGELAFGHGRGKRDVVGVTLGTGFGVGVVLDGKLRRGRNCGVGEIGAIPYREETLEDYCSGRFFARHGGVPAERLAERASAGDQEALDLFRRFGTELGVALQVVLYAYDPELIVLGGSISRSLPLFETSMRAALSSFAYPRSLQSLCIEVSELADASILGATVLFHDSKAVGPKLLAAEVPAGGPRARREPVEGKS